MRRRSLDSFYAIRSAHRAGQAPALTLREFAALLRQILISYRGRENMGGCTGAAWIEAINDLAPAAGFDEPQLRLLAHDRYRRDSDCDIEGLLDSGEAWIRALPREKYRAAA